MFLIFYMKWKTSGCLGVSQRKNWVREKDGLYPTEKNRINTHTHTLKNAVKCQINNVLFIKNYVCGNKLCTQTNHRKGLVSEKKNRHL